MRWLVAIMIGLLLAFLVLRQAVVTAFAGRDPATAAVLWPSHPSVVLESGLAQIGEAAATGRPANAALVDRLLHVSAKAPLAPEPFLVRGVQARVDGNEAVAGRSFVAARERNPRLAAARYFLADHYLTTGETREGLSEIAALAGLVPQSLPQVAPYLAAYARTPGAASGVKAMIREHPRLEALLLDVLAADARDGRLALYLWSGRSDEGSRRWQERLIRSLVSAGSFAEAGSAWSRFSGGLAAGQADPEFQSGRLAPFGWTFSSDSAGIAEAQGQGRLHVLYYGRSDKVLASQLLMLRPGRYRLSMQVTEAAPTTGSLGWSVRCVPSSAEAASLPLGRVRSGALATAFVVPAAGCGAQWLELKGTAPEFAEQAEATIAKFRLAREGLQ